MTVSAGGETPDGGRVDGLAPGYDGGAAPCRRARASRGGSSCHRVPDSARPATSSAAGNGARGGVVCGGSIRVGPGRVAASRGRHLAVILRGVAAPRQRTLARRAPERDVGVIAAVSDDSSRGAVRGVIRDVSLGGLSFATAETLHVGDWISIEYAQGRERVAAAGSLRPGPGSSPWTRNRTTARFGCAARSTASRCRGSTRPDGDRLCRRSHTCRSSRFRMGPSGRFVYPPQLPTFAHRRWI